MSNSQEQPTGDWPEIDKFDRFDLPEFPTDALPSPLREFVLAVAEATQTPPDLAGLLALAVAGTTLAKCIKVEPRPRWVEPVNLYVAVLMAPGTRKSAVFKECLLPLSSLERELIRKARTTEQATSNSATPTSSKDEPGSAARRMEAPQTSLPRLVVDDATPEQLEVMLQQQGGRIASMSSEGNVFDSMAAAARKNGVPQLSVYLKGHAGDDLRTDRITRDGVHVEEPALTCAYAVQPSVISKLAGNKDMRSRGLPGRFLYAVPSSMVGRRKIAPPPVPQRIADDYATCIEKLFRLSPQLLTLSTQAQSVFQHFEHEVEGMLADGGAMEAYTDWGSKLVGATLRIAGIMHCIASVTDVIEAPTLDSAITLARYLIPHAEEVLSNMGHANAGIHADAIYILSWIESNACTTFTKREVQQQRKNRFPRAVDIDAPLKELEARGFIRIASVEGNSPGRPSVTYEVNPTLYGEQP